ncbi:MAG: hypothetical protein K2L37_05150 [Lactobacillus sp.]|nr:hypothetical protein [Lactobacillus sp.]
MNILSIDYKLNRLRETATGTAQNLFKQEDLKTVVDALTSVMNIIDALTSKLGLFGSVGFGAGLFAGIKNVGKPKKRGFRYCFEYADNNMCSLGY